jgi:hypothetical protein
MKMRLGALRQPVVTDGDHDREQGLRDHLLYVMDEKCLERARPLGEYRACRIISLEVLGNVIGIRDNMGCLGISSGVNNDREGVDWTSVCFPGTWKCTDGT